MINCNCHRDPDTGEYLCHKHGKWVSECPLDGVEEDEDGFLIDTNENKNRKGNTMDNDTMVINGEEWVRKASIPEVGANVMAPMKDGLPYCMVRTYSAGVFAGYVESLDGKCAVLRKARRIWYWDGAASLSELATHGTSKPKNCKFPCEVERVRLTEVIEVIDITAEAKASIDGVPVWTAR